MMQAVILAAGRGSRLAGHNTERLPKCLMEFGGRSLLARHLELLSRLGIRKTDLVIGYEADRIIDHVGKLFSRPDVDYHYNPRYEQGSVLSLLAASDTLESGDPIILMDADVLYQPAILQVLMDTDIENCCLLDQHFMAGDEPVKIAVEHGVIVEFRKKLPAGLSYDTIGESVGFFRFGAECGAAIAAECARFDQQGLGEVPHEEALRNVLLRSPHSFGFEDISGLEWIEIDFPEDVDRAESEVLPAIQADNPGF